MGIIIEGENAFIEFGFLVTNNWETPFRKTYVYDHDLAYIPIIYQVLGILMLTGNSTLI